MFRRISQFKRYHMQKKFAKIWDSFHFTFPFHHLQYTFSHCTLPVPFLSLFLNAPLNSAWNFREMRKKKDTPTGLFRINFNYMLNVDCTRIREPWKPALIEIKITRIIFQNISRFVVRHLAYSRALSAWRWNERKEKKNVLILGRKLYEVWRDLFLRSFKYNDANCFQNW